MHKIPVILCDGNELFHSQSNILLYSEWGASGESGLDAASKNLSRTI
jgi:hypothetical protein